MEPKEKEVKGLEYREIQCGRFAEAVDCVVDSVEDNSFCLVDIDGTLITNQFVKLPFVCHFADSHISSDIQESFSKLAGVFDSGNLALVTNRNGFERLVWNSNTVLDNAKSLLSKNGIENSLYTFLNKQVHWLFSDRSNQLVEQIASCVNTESVFTLYSIEDFSYVSLNRDSFLNEIGKRLKDELGLDIRIVNYVIKG